VHKEYAQWLLEVTNNR